MEKPLPWKYIALKDSMMDVYLEYVHEGSSAGYLRHSANNLVSVYTKFEIVPAKEPGRHGRRVNIRSCYNNKFWASSNDNNHMVTPSVDEPHEDQNSWPCTLFEVRGLHPKYSLWDLRRQASVAKGESNNVIYDHCLTTADGTEHLLTSYIMVDFGSILVLPKHVAFKGDNGKYLGFTAYNSMAYLEFFSDDIGDSRVGHQVFPMSDGSIRIKSDEGGFWRLDPDWIKPDSGDKTGNDKNTLFWPTKVSKNVVALRNLGNNCYCKRLTADDKTSCLNAGIYSITKEAQMEIEEPVVSREIYNAVFRPNDARIRDQQVEIMASADTTNDGTEAMEHVLELKYSDTRTKSWDSSLTISLGVTTSMEIGVPLIAEGKIEISENFTGSYSWGETITKTKELTSTYNVHIPPKTRLKVGLVATTGTCDIPFSYTQRDTLRSGEVVTTICDDGIYVGKNSYNFRYESKNIPI